MSSEVREHFCKRLLGLVKLNLVFETITGLLIQMPEAAQAYRIGGADKYPMVTRKIYSIDGKDLELEVPFIPGSSLKGRMRSLLELAHGLKLYTTDRKIWQHVRSLQAMKDFNDFVEDVRSRDVVDELFGWAAVNYKQILDAANHAKIPEPEKVVNEIFSILAPTRLLFSDFFPTQEYIVTHKVTSIADFLEEKPENRIDRVTSAADPREVVRVRPGVRFEGTITLLLFDKDDDVVKGEKLVNRYIDTILLGLQLIEETYIGSSGSRGYGRVRIVGRDITIYKIEPVTSKLIQVELLPFKDFKELQGYREKIVSTVEQLFK